MQVDLNRTDLFIIKSALEDKRYALETNIHANTDYDRDRKYLKELEYALGKVMDARREQARIDAETASANEALGW